MHTGKRLIVIALVFMCICIGATQAPASVSFINNNFTMLAPDGTITGGTNDVAFTWDGSKKTSVAASGQVSNASLSSTCPFLGVTWSAHDMAIYGPGTYTVYDGCPAGSPGCGSGNPVTFTVGSTQLGGHMLFDWGGSYDIDVVNVWQPNTVFGPSEMCADETNCGGQASCGANPATKAWDWMSIDWNNDGINGNPMTDGPFVDFNANFNVRADCTANALPGTVTMSPGYAWIVGSGTNFTTDLIGQQVQVNGVTYSVVGWTNPTLITISVTYQGPYITGKPIFKVECHDGDLLPGTVTMSPGYAWIMGSGTNFTEDLIGQIVEVEGSRYNVVGRYNPTLISVSPTYAGPYITGKQIYLITGGGASCTTPWGTSIVDGTSVYAAASSSPPCDQQCAYQVRTCNNGVLSGSYQNKTCLMKTCSCTTPWGATIGNGGSVTAYANSSPGCGMYCVSQTRTCNDGTLSGSYRYQSCTKNYCSCAAPWGTTIGHGGSVTAYASNNPGCGTSCVPQTRTCSDGTLSGSYQYQSCSKTPCSCLWADGSTSPHGWSGPAYGTTSCSTLTTLCCTDGSWYSNNCTTRWYGTPNKTCIKSWQQVYGSGNLNTDSCIAWLTRTNQLGDQRAVTVNSGGLSTGLCAYWNPTIKDCRFYVDTWTGAGYQPVGTCTDTSWTLKTWSLR